MRPDNRDRKRQQNEGAKPVECLSAVEDPVLAELWDNDDDAVYDDIEPERGDSDG